MDTVKVSSKGQIVIPKALREAMNIRAGTELTISALADGLKLAPALRVERTRVADGLGLLARPGRKARLSDVAAKRRIRALLKERDEATRE